MGHLAGAVETKHSTFSQERRNLGDLLMSEPAVGSDRGMLKGLASRL